MNILFTCAGRRNYLINYFKNALNGNGQIFATDMDLRAPSLIDADVSIQVPAIYDPNYINVLKNIIKENNINAVISLNDLELPILAKNKSDLESLGAKIIVADDNAINISFDKWETVNFLKSIGLKSPKTYLSLNAAKLALKNGEIFFPLVIKPR